MPMRFRPGKIRTRFFAAMIALSLPPLFLLGYLSFDIARDALTKTNTQIARNHLKTSDETADLLFRDVVRLNRSLVLNDDIRKTLSAGPYETGKSALVGKLQKVVYSDFADLRFVSSVCLFDLKFEAYCIGRPDNAGIYEGAGKEEAIRQADWYRETVDARGKIVFFSRDVLDGSDKSFSTVKLYRDSETIAGRPIGLVVVNLSRAIFNAVFPEDPKYGGAFAVVDASKQPAVLLYRRAQPELEPLLYGPIDDMTARLAAAGYIVNAYENETTGWTFLYLIRTDELLRESGKIGTATAWIASAIALVGLGLSYLVSGTITRPLLSLKKMMIEWTKGVREFTQTFGQDEVGVIGETFKRIARENEILNEKLVLAELKKREAELKALQAQINPHFLYNTLDSIYWMATLQNHPDIAQMAVSLSKSFKLSLNKGRDLIPIRLELEHIRHYMTIQNIRYNRRFRYEENVDPALLDLEMLKLVLQPIVENAVTHGLEPKVGSGTVRLSGERDGDWVVFTVEDDGVGMDNLDVVEQGFGIRNVRERLTLFYGTNCSFDIASSPNAGTRVQIRFKPVAGGTSHAESRHF